MFNFNNIRFHKAKTGLSIYLFGGPGLATYSTLYKQDDSYLPGYATIIAEYPEDHAHKGDIRKALKSVLTGKWNHIAERPFTASTLGGAPLTVVGVLGVGMEFKLSSKLNISIENKFTFTGTPLVDGQQWQNNWTPGAIQSVASTRSAETGAG